MRRAQHSKVYFPIDLCDELLQLGELGKGLEVEHGLKNENVLCTNLVIPAPGQLCSQQSRGDNDRVLVETRIFLTIPQNQVFHGF